MKTILILAEQYWFESNNTSQANYLFNEIKSDKFKIEIMKTPENFVNKVEEIGKGNIKLIFLFHDLIGDSYLNNMTIKEMIKYLYDLRDNHNIKFYPGIKVTNLFSSKRYYSILLNKFKEFILPKTEIFPIKFVGQVNFINKKLWEIVNKMWKNFDKVVIKKGYTYNSVQVKIFDKKNTDYKSFKNKMRQMNMKYLWNKKINSLKYEKDLYRFYQIQGYNKIIRDALNEFRVFFLNGKAKYVAWYDNIDNVCSDDLDEDIEPFDYTEKKKKIINKDLFKIIINFAKKVYKDYTPTFWKEDYPLILFRIDISYAIDPEFQDEFSQDIILNGKKTKIRIYINELESDPTSFYYNNLICKKNASITNEYVQRKLGEGINNLINKIE